MEITTKNYLQNIGWDFVLKDFGVTADILISSAKYQSGGSCSSSQSTALVSTIPEQDLLYFIFCSSDPRDSQKKYLLKNTPNTKFINKPHQDSTPCLLPRRSSPSSKNDLTYTHLMLFMVWVDGSFHMKFPFLFTCVNKCKMEQFRKQFQTVLDESFRGFADLYFNLFWNFVEVVEFVSNQANQITY